MKMDEMKATGAYYTIQFYDDVQQLTHHFSQYRNMLLQIEHNFGVDNIAKIDESTREQINNTVQTIRHYANVVYVKYKGLVLYAEDERLNEVIETYNKIKTTYVFQIADIEQFVILVNAYLVNKVMKDLLVTSTQIMSGIYE